ncbi:hypothetical protein GWI33_013970 [Rhynchophorus ferrugineus]|uniref:Acyltransferase 3 domain-containing protein n=1 Tax=Rhynchophorus ferrugineus TaxID=354439 RepID=A0A834M9H7_RHYFE|nr:hypothetical protein GWI33_013970 [Rhynchophorus ferrugineus]
MMGYVYFNTKQMNIKLSKVQNILWIFLFLGLPTLSISMCFLDVKGVYRAFLGPILKPMFALGLGLGVLGMSKGYGGPIKRILEWDMAIKMSNFTYCTYLYHLFLIFLMHGSTRSLYRYSVFYMVLSYVQDVLVSFCGGILMTLLIEYPGLRLQKNICATD